MPRLPNPWRPSSRKYKKKEMFVSVKRSRMETTAAASSMSNFYFSLYLVLFFLFTHKKMAFNGLKKTSTSFYVDVMKTKLTTFICCFTEFNEHTKKWAREPSGRYNVKYFTSINATTWDVDERGERERKKRTNRINCGWAKVSGTSSRRRVERESGGPL